MVLLLAAIPAWGAPLPPYTYSMPEGDADLGAAWSKWEPETELYVAGMHTELRAEGGAAGKILFHLDAGQPVEVLTVGEEAVWRGRRNTWYEVQAGERRGWVYGGDLTPYAFRADLDGDGNEEIATVAFTADFGVRVLVVEPKLKAANTSWIDLETAGGAYLGQKGSDLVVDFISDKKAGVALIHVWSGVQACADFSDTWVSYSAPDATTPGMPRIALEQGGLVDPPSCSTYEVKFDARRKLATVVRSEGGCSGERKDKPKVEETRFVLVDGVYKAERAGGVVR